jgi:outer membrane protein OmpA-like peptidoglycan-associated protein
MQLVEKLNGVLVTRDTPRGLVVTISDSSFSGSELRGGVSSRIARLASILATYPDLRILVEGSSDSASNDSQATRRAESVRQALVANGMPANRAAVRALGDSRPRGFTTPRASEGPQQNRRVEIDDLRRPG